MTIFLEITRDFVIDALEEIHKRLEAADNGLLGGWRNKPLSEAKKKLVTSFISDMRQFANAAHDLATKNAICDRVRQTKLDGFEKSTAHGQLDEGNFGKEFNNLSNLVEHIFSKFNSAQLLDIEKSADPFNIFCYHSAYYLAQKARESIDPGYLAFITHNPTFSDLWQLNKAKEQLVKSQIELCRQSLLAYDKAHPGYMKFYRDRVLDFVKEVTQANERACSDHKTKFGLPILSFGFFAIFTASSSIAPKLGFLDTCMQRVKTEIEENEQRERILRQRAASDGQILLPSILAGVSASVAAASSVSVAASSVPSLADDEQGLVLSDLEQVAVPSGDFAEALAPTAVAVTLDNEQQMVSTAAVSPSKGGIFTHNPSAASASALKAKKAGKFKL